MQDANNIVPFRSLLPAARNVQEAREDGYNCLTPLERAVAIEFATTGHTIKQVAADLNQPLAACKAAFNDIVVRAFICDLQAEVAAHKIINAAWVEQQVLSIWPQLIGEESVYVINKSGDEVCARKFHGPEVASLLRHFSGNADQKKAGGVNVIINFDSMGVSPPRPIVNISEGRDGG